MKNDDEKGDPTIIDYRYSSRLEIGKEIDRRVTVELQLFELLSRTQEFNRLKELMIENAKVFEKNIGRMESEAKIKKIREKEVEEAIKLGISQEDLQQKLEDIKLETRKRHIM